MEGGVKMLLLAVIMATLVLPAFAEGEKTRGDGLFSEGSFLSEALSSASDKINRVASGEERIVDDDAKGIDKDILEYDRDPLGRSKAALRNDEFRDYRRKIKREEKQEEPEIE